MQLIEKINILCAIFIVLILMGCGSFPKKQPQPKFHNGDKIKLVSSVGVLDDVRGTITGTSCDLNDGCSYEITTSCWEFRRAREDQLTLAN